MLYKYIRVNPDKKAIQTNGREHLRNTSSGKGCDAGDA